MKTAPFFLLVCCLAQIASAQPCPQAAQIRSSLKTNYETGLLDQAFENVKALRACDPASSQEADQWAERIFAEIKKRAEVETAKTHSELKQSASNLKLLEARNYFDKSLTYKSLACLMQAQEVWDGNTEARAMFDSMADYCPDWMAQASGYVGINKSNTIIGYFDESTERGGLCDYVARNIVTGDTLVFRQVSKFSFFSMAAEFSKDGEKVVYYTEVDSTEHGTINIYDSRRKRTFQFQNAILSENWLSENGRTFVFLKDTLGDNGHQLVYAFDFETESLHALGKSSMVSGDWRFWISPDGENVIYCTHKNPNQGDLGTFCLYNLKNKTSRHFDQVYAHGPEFSTDSRYMSVQHSGEETGMGSLIDLKTGKVQAAIINTTFIEGYASPVTIRLLDYGKGRKISTYDPEQKKWVDTPMPKNLTKQSDILFEGDMLLYTLTDSTTALLNIGVYQPSKHRDFVFSDDYLASMSLFGIAQGLNKGKNICLLANEYSEALRSYDFENGQIHSFPYIIAIDNKLRRQYLGFSTDNGDWLWGLKHKPVDGYGFDLALLKRDGSTTVIDSGYFNFGFFTNLGDQPKFVYVKKLQKGAKDQREIVLFDLNSGSRILLKAYASNQLSADKYDFTDLWLDEDRDLMVYSPAPKTFCVWDLNLNKAIRTFKIEQEYQNMELRGASGLLEISFKNGVKKWIQIDAPAKPFQWHIDQLKKQK